MREIDEAYKVWFALVHSTPEVGREDKRSEAIHAQGRYISRLTFRLPFNGHI